MSERSMAPAVRRGAFRRAALAVFAAALAACSMAAQSAVAEAACPNEAIREKEHAVYLAECRAWEQVSPVDKNSIDLPDGRLGFPSPYMHAIESGDTVSWEAKGAFGGSPLSSVITGYVSHRPVDDSSWVTSPAEIPVGYLGSPSSTFATSDDLTHAIVGSELAFAPGAVKGNGNLYLRDLATGGIQLIATSDEEAWVNYVAHGSGPREAVVTAANRDFSELVLTTNTPLDPAAAGQPEQAYLYRDGRLELISRMPDGSFAGALDFARITAGGSRIYLGGPIVTQGAPMYLREGGVTEPISISERAGDGDLPVNVFPIGTSADGRYAFFLSLAPLTEEAPEVNSNGGDLYRYDAETRSLSDLTAEDANGGEVIGEAVLVSSDREHVYLVAGGELAPGAVKGMPNLYYIGPDLQPRVVATLDSFPSAQQQQMAMSPSGRYLAFQSTSRLTSYDNQGVSEVYLYDADTGSIECASCPGGTAAPNGPGLLGRSNNIIGAITEHPRVVLDDGTVFIDTPESLSPRDSNGRYDVYSFRKGVQDLLSSGTGGNGSYFQESADEGRSVFFATRDRLVAQDDDDLIDLYVARVGGGIEAQTGAPPSEPCSGEGCQPTSVAPSPATIGSGALDAPPSGQKPKPKPKPKSRHKPKHAKQKHHRKSTHKKKHHGKAHGHNKAAKGKKAQRAHRTDARKAGNR